jgi:hypothetical protein
VEAGKTRQNNGAQQHEGEHDADFKCFARDLEQAVSARRTTTTAAQAQTKKKKGFREKIKNQTAYRS